MKTSHSPIQIAMCDAYSKDAKARNQNMNFTTSLKMPKAISANTK